MKHFTIDNENNITLHANRQAARGTGAGVFASEIQFADLIGNDNKRLIEIWNRLPGVTPVKKFTNRQIATERIWKAIQSLGELASAQVPEAAPEIATEPVVQSLQPEPAPESVAAPASSEPSMPAADRQPGPEPDAADQTPEPSVAPAEAAQQTTPFDEPVANVSAQAPDVAPTDAKPTKKTTRTKKTSTSEPEALAATEATQEATIQGVTTEPVANVGAQAAGVVATEPAPTKKTIRARKTPTDAPKAIRQGSKTDQAIAMMKRPTGATLPELMATFGWQAHTVRGFVAGALTKKLGLKVASTKPEGGERTYSINA
jgi:Protein of unknown function (DUF3489)